MSESSRDVVNDQELSERLRGLRDRFDELRGRL
jgi:hypothetical protein